jgi:drug/metabolite transporter (DMT)-like permease
MTGGWRRLPAGVVGAIASALLFGLSTPLAKLLLGETPPLLLAGLLYAGSGVGLLAVRLFARATDGEAAPGRADVPRLAGAVLAGGILGPVLLLSGLRATPASTASLLLNLESVFTALLAWFVFRENVDRRIALGFALIVAGGVALSWQDGRLALAPGVLLIAAACLAWAVDNNLTQGISGLDPVRLAAIKGGVAGAVNLALAALTGVRWPSSTALAGALLVGFLGYGLSLALFVTALRHLGTARTGAYFSIAPFFGAVASLVLFRESLSGALLAAGGLMAVGVWLHLTEHHEHEHGHPLLEHAHRHVHDEHHPHAHDEPVPGDPHSHRHVHESLRHRHPHYPDTHHRHGHG